MRKFRSRSWFPSLVQRGPRLIVTNAENVLPVPWTALTSVLPSELISICAAKSEPILVEQFPDHPRVFRIAFSEGDQDGLTSSSIVLKLATEWESWAQVAVHSRVADVVPRVFGTLPHESNFPLGTVAILMEALTPSIPQVGVSVNSRQPIPHPKASYMRAIQKLAAVHHAFEGVDDSALRRVSFEGLVNTVSAIPDLLTFLIAAGLELESALVDEVRTIGTHVYEHIYRCSGTPARTLVHLDFHPFNVLLSASGAPRIIDWGSAAWGACELDLAMCDAEQVRIYFDARASLSNTDPNGGYARLRSAVIVRMYEFIAAASGVLFGAAPVVRGDVMLNSIPLYVERLVSAASANEFMGGEPIADMLRKTVRI